MIGPTGLSALRQKVPTIIVSLFTIALAAGCASTSLKSRESLVTEKLPRPRRILIYDFAGTSSDVPRDSVLVGHYSEQTFQTTEEIQACRALGVSIASQLSDLIENMGLPAMHVLPDVKPRINDIVIRGYLLSVVEGSAANRVVIGFGAGASGLETAVGGFQMTANGLRRLGSATLDASGGKSPGAALGVVGFIATANPVGLIVSGGAKVYGEASGSSKIEGRAKATAKLIADQIKIRAKEEGWIE